MKQNSQWLSQVRTRSNTALDTSMPREAASTAAAVASIAFGAQAADQGLEAHRVALGVLALMGEGTPEAKQYRQELAMVLF